MCPCETRDLVKAKLNTAILKNTTLEKAHLDSANLRDADLRNANLTLAELKNANLQNANLEMACLERVDFRQTNLINANLNYEDLSCANLRCVDLSTVKLQGVNLNGADLTGANLDGVNLNYIALPDWNNDSLDLYLSHINNDSSLLTAIDSIDAKYNDKKIALVHQLINSLDKRPSNVSLSSVVEPLLETFAKAPYNQDQKIINWLNNKILPSYLAKYAVSTMPVLTNLSSG
ncbi:pentapeptide repeat-containing protein [Arsenophonus sp. PmNCSU2021_1]|uniref:pentapeptide repeat-containing protein n=1 Tax=Arsenophonus sp. PmNCSU2021_1 TaxID=3118989 RepID=UPI002FF3DE48